MTKTSLGTWVLIVVLAISVVVSAWRLCFSKYRLLNAFYVGWETDSAHIAMNSGMALLLIPWCIGGLVTGVTIVYCLLALGSAVSLLVWLSNRHSHREHRTAQLGAIVYHLLATGAMLYMLRAGNQMACTMGMGDMKHEPSRADWIFASLFFLDFLTTAAVVLMNPKTVSMLERRFVDHNEAHAEHAKNSDDTLAHTLGASVGARILTTLPHVAMDIGMVAMLVRI